jgi:hypothetical protein
MKGGRQSAAKLWVSLGVARQLNSVLTNRIRPWRSNEHVATPSWRMSDQMRDGLAYLEAACR